MAEPHQGPRGWLRPIFLDTLYEDLFGVQLRAKPRVHELAQLFEVLSGAWEAVRDWAIPKLLEAQSGTGGGRFDVSAVLYALEHPLPMALLPYHLAVRRGVRQHDGENLWFATEKFTAIEAVVRQRKNYKFALLFKVHCYEAWGAGASTLPLAEFIDHNTVALNESFGGGGS